MSAPPPANDPARTLRSRLEMVARQPPEWSRISRARGPEVASRVGIALGTALVICFLTGLISHGIQHPPDWFFWPAHPVWLYRVTQGAHVISGVSAIPLVLVKLWSVYPRLFQRPLLGNPVRVLERGSIALLVGAVLFELSTGLLNIAQWYPWKFFFPTAHYAMAWIMTGALAVHLAVKLPVIRSALGRPLESADPDANVTERGHAADSGATDAGRAGERDEVPDGVGVADEDGSVDRGDSSDRAVGAVSRRSDSGENSGGRVGFTDRDEVGVGAEGADRTDVPGGVESTTSDREGTARESGVARRTVLAAAALSAVVAGLSVAGQAVPFLRGIAVAAPRSGRGPQRLPVNRTALAAGVGDSARDPGYRLAVVVGERRAEFTREELLALPRTSARLPIACVEGWSVNADWSGVRLLDLLAAVGSYGGGDVEFRSLETGGIYRTSLLPHRHAVASDTLVALTLNGEDLDLDHGYPCRLIAPNRPGVLQTKWLAAIEARS